MPAVKSKLPDYVNPPVVETVLGVQFDRLTKLRNGYLGAFWASLGMKQWPTIGDAPPLATQVEQFSVARWGGMRLQLTQDLSSRIQAKNPEGNWMVQVQNTRLHFNWIKSGEAYPRYEAVRTEFANTWERFQKFVAEHELGQIRPNQWEVTYVNQIPVGTVWKTPSDWGFFRPLSNVPSIDGVIDAESFAGAWHFVIPENRGRLHIDWEHGSPVRTESGEPSMEESIRLNLTSRGPVPEDDNSVLAGLDLGHETIVRAFASLMSDDANQYWGLKNDSNSG